MRHTYTILDYTKLVALFYRNGDKDNATRAAEEFTISFPDRPQPNRKVVRKVIQRFRDTGSVAERKRSGKLKFLAR